MLTICRGPKSDLRRAWACPPKSLVGRFLLMVPSAMSSVVARIAL